MKALILVDIQNDFLPGGALAVQEGDVVIPIANRLMSLFPLVIATQDWHTANHASFAANHRDRMIGEVIDLDGLPQVMWPVHCVQNSPGAELAAALERSRIDLVVPKGTNPRIDSYSGFFDNGGRNATGLEAELRRRGVDDIYLLGLATDYCVRATALDAMKLGFRTWLVVDGCRGVELEGEDCQRAIMEMERAGVRLTNSEDVVARSRG